MRVLQLGPYPPPHGGVQTNLVAIRGYLRGQGILCAVINLTRHRKPDSDDVYYPAGAAGLLWRLLTLPYDILHLHIGGNLTARLLGLSLVCCLIPGKKAVLTFHSGGFPASPEGQKLEAGTFAAFVLRRFDAIIGVNSEIMGWMLRMGVDPARLHHIPPHGNAAVPAGRLSPSLEVFYRDHDPVLLTVGLLEPEYDLGIQIEVLGIVRRHVPRAGLVIIGSGSLEHELRNRIASVPWAADILLEGDVPHPITLKAMAEATMLLRTTLYDGDAVSVREALQLRTPVIASDNGMRPEGVQLIPARDLAALERAILQNLAEKRTRPAGASRSDENLEAVLALYRAL